MHKEWETERRLRNRHLFLDLQRAFNMYSFSFLVHVSICWQSVFCHWLLDEKVERVIPANTIDRSNLCFGKLPFLEKIIRWSLHQTIIEHSLCARHCTGKQNLIQHWTVPPQKEDIWLLSNLTSWKLVALHYARYFREKGRRLWLLYHLATLE